MLPGSVQPSLFYLTISKKSSQHIHTFKGRKHKEARRVVTGEQGISDASRVLSFSVSTAVSDMHTQVEHVQASSSRGFCSGALKAEMKPVRPHWLVFKWVGESNSPQHATPHTSVCVCVHLQEGPGVTKSGRRQQNLEITARQLFLVIAPLEVRLSVKMVLQQNTVITW